MNTRNGTYRLFPSQFRGPRAILDQRPRPRPEVKKFTPNELIDGSALKEIERSGFVKQLYGK
jgi:hypothetical protein